MMRGGRMIRGKPEPEWHALSRASLSPWKDRARRASARLFQDVIEPLNDSFSRAGRERYYKLFARVVEMSAGNPESANVWRELNQRGIRGCGDLLRELEARRKAPTVADPAHVFILSRVTLGADVAVTSRFVGRAAEVFPRADVHLLGGSRLRELFGGHPTLRLDALEYPRRGSVIERLECWAAAADRIRALAAGRRYLVLDPDSRITQLGLLPLNGAAGEHIIFEGTARGRADRRSLSRHAGEWLDETLRGTGCPVSPSEGARVWLAREQTDEARGVLGAFGLHARGFLTASFGTGGNPAKRVGARFENELITRLLRRGETVVLDSGADPDDERRVLDVGEACRRQGHATKVLEAGKGVRTLAGPTLVIWRGGVGFFAALAGMSRAYVGYDSLFQHVAAAQGIPVATVFKGFRSPLFPARWKPEGPGEVNVIALSPRRTPDPRRIAAEIENWVSSIKGAEDRNLL